jgi:hypothetical protein
MKNIEICRIKQKYLNTQKNQRTLFNGRKLETAQKIIRAILNLADETPIEDWTQNIENRHLSKIL